MRSICVIPARMGASRFPGKPLAPLLGLPMVCHIYRRCRLYTGFERTVVATCDEVIRDAVENDGGEVVMTSDRHERATDRVVEAVQNMALGLAETDFALMVQGDEILAGPDMLKTMVESYAAQPGDVVNLISPLRDVRDHDDPNTVKVVYDLNDRALYMSRAAIPSRTRAKGPLPLYQQTGIIGFSAGFLRRFGELPQTSLEQIESVDMMRAIECGFTVRVVRAGVETIGVDTPADISRAEAMLKADPVTSRYLNR